jgi:glucokinase
MSEGDREKISARIVLEAARMGDRTAVSIVEKVSEYFTQAILNIAILFAPDIIVLSGGVMRSADLFMPRIQKTMQEYREMVPTHRIQIVPAQLGYYAGLYGSAYTIFNNYL